MPASIHTTLSLICEYGGSGERWGGSCLSVLPSAEFHANTKEGAIAAATEAGWQLEGSNAYCPKCARSIKKARTEEVDRRLAELANPPAILVNRSGVL